MDENYKLDCFSHGQVVSKIWLCDELEKIISQDTSYDLHVLGGWTNLISFMLLVRNKIKFNIINSYDIDSSSNLMADKINDAWRFLEPKVYSNCINIEDINYVSHNGKNIYINCSVEHLESRTWFNKLPHNSLVVIQSTNVQTLESPWHVTDPVTNLEDLKERYPLNLVYTGIKEIRYSHFGYDRYMIIGYL